MLSFDVREHAIAILNDLCSFLRQCFRAGMLRAAVAKLRSHLSLHEDLERRRQMPLLIGKSQIALLLFLLDSERTLDPIRLMKGMFIFTMEAPETWLAKHERYQFIPYSWGPYSRTVDDDVDQFIKQGYVRISKVAGKNWDYYYLSEKGKKKAKELADAMPPEAATYLRRVRQFVLKVGFRELLDTVYEKYPAYAVKSVFRH